MDSERMIKTEMIKQTTEAAVNWWAEKITGKEPHNNGSDDFESFAACMMADMGRKNITEKQLFIFKEVLRGSIEMTQCNGDYMILSCDYGPDRDLSFAADQAGINYLNFPFKTWMKIENGKVEVHEGYASPGKIIFEFSEKRK